MRARAEKADRERDWQIHLDVRDTGIGIPPDRMEEERRIITQLKRGGRVEPYETVRLAKGGRPLDVSLAVSPVRDADGRVVEASVILRDASAHKRAEAALRDSESRLRVTSGALEYSVRIELKRCASPSASLTTRSL